jgi:hypothetical protein
MMSSVLNVFGKAHEVIHDICDGRAKWTMSIPANEDTDSDLVLAKALTLGSRAANLLDQALPYLKELEDSFDKSDTAVRHLRSVIAQSKAILEKVDGK